MLVSKKAILEGRRFDRADGSKTFYLTPASLTESRFRLSLFRMSQDTATILRAHGIQPSAQRVAVAEYMLQTDAHPSADQVWTTVRQYFPMLSRATVYNTLNLFVEKGLVRQHVLAEGKVVFDPKVENHHHFIE